MALVNVTGTFYLPTGEVGASRTIVLRRKEGNVFAQLPGAILPDDTVIKTASDGTVDFTILSGNYLGTTAAVTGSFTSRRSVNFSMAVPDQETAVISDIINVAELPDELPTGPQGPAGPAGEDAPPMVVLTQAEYDALGTPDPETFYFISG